MGPQTCVCCGKVIPEGQMVCYECAALVGATGEEEEMENPKDEKPRHRNPDFLLWVRHLRTSFRKQKKVR